MATLDDPEFLEALEKLFASREDMSAITEYQRKLYESLVALHGSHRDVHERVRILSESHLHGQEEDTRAIERTKQELETLLKNLEQAHDQTKREMIQAANEINRIAQEVRKVSLLEERLERLEREQREFLRAEQLEERINRDQEERLRREEEKNRDQENRLRDEERKHREQEERIRRLEHR